MKKVKIPVIAYFCFYKFILVDVHRKSKHFTNLSQAIQTVAIPDSGGLLLEGFYKCLRKTINIFIISQFILVLY